MRALLAVIFVAGVARAEAPPDERPRGTYVRVPGAGTSRDPRLGPKHRVLFVNGGGGGYAPSNVEDSSANKSTIADFGSYVGPKPAWIIRRFLERIRATVRRSRNYR